MSTPDPNNPYNPYATPTVPPPGQSGQQPPAAQGWGAPQAQPPGAPGYGVPPQPGAPGGQPWGAAPMAPPAAPAAPKNGAVAILTGLAVAVVVGVVYAFVVKAIDHEFSWAVIGIAALVGFTIGKLGGKNPVLPFFGSLFSVISLFVGEFLAIAMILSDEAEKYGAKVSTLEVFTQHFDTLFDAWKDNFDAYSALFVMLGLVIGFTTTKKAADS
ncbi:hypothetical protein HUT16_13490 [Kitasatospora sp. NA04385]|uniref:hypothetical protein n=1 Tax=Kitasatospora sp. NA04385 TaxID=2742135 RepID=UPI00159078A4|nr:hypothetical protein [Kitasatospora sp. NA04385]QKW19939.1 hypothetical protein HUT16_13490 [Kitasatospora sp. NA04385]